MAPNTGNTLECNSFPIHVIYVSKNNILASNPTQGQNSQIQRRSHLLPLRILPLDTWAYDLWINLFDIPSQQTNFMCFFYKILQIDVNQLVSLIFIYMVVQSNDVCNTQERVQHISSTIRSSHVDVLHGFFSKKIKNHRDHQKYWPLQSDRPEISPCGGWVVRVATLLWSRRLGQDQH